MTFPSVGPADDVQGQATYGLANLRRGRTGLPFVVFMSRKDAARHDVRVKVAPGPRMRPDQMSSHALLPFALAEGKGMPAVDERLLARWVEANLQVLADHGDGRIEQTEDALDLLEPV